MTIRPYTPQDRQKLCDLFAELIENHKEYISHGELQMGIATDRGELGPDFRNAWLRYLDRQTADPETEIMLAEQDGTPTQIQRQLLNGKGQCLHLRRRRFRQLVQIHHAHEGEIQPGEQRSPYQTLLRLILRWVFQLEGNIGICQRRHGRKPPFTAVFHLFLVIQRSFLLTFSQDLSLRVILCGFCKKVHDGSEDA